MCGVSSGPEPYGHFFRWCPPVSSPTGRANPDAPRSRSHGTNQPSTHPLVHSFNPPIYIGDYALARPAMVRFLSWGLAAVVAATYSATRAAAQLDAVAKWADGLFASTDSIVRAMKTDASGNGYAFG